MGHLIVLFAIFQSWAFFTADAHFCACLVIIPFFLFNETLLLLYAFLFQFYLWKFFIPIFHLLILLHSSFSPCLIETFMLLFCFFLYVIIYSLLTGTPLSFFPFPSFHLSLSPFCCLLSQSLSLLLRKR